MGEPRHGGKRGDPLMRQPARDEAQQDVLDDEIGDPGAYGEQRESGERFGPGRQVAEEWDGVEDREAFGRELAHGVLPAAKRALSPVAACGADTVPIAAAAVNSWVVERQLHSPALSNTW